MTHYAPMVAALVAMMLIFILTQSKLSKGIQDMPNERSLHEQPVPRLGGVGMMAGILTGWALMLHSLTWWIVLPMLLLFVVSLMDDMKGVPVYRRLATHGVAGLILVVGSGLLTHQPLLALPVLLAVVWMTNLYNFMDGSDGLAAGMTIIGFTVYGVASLMHGLDTQAMMNFTVAAGGIGFLYHNFHPARVFMGDAGSIPLGFLAAGMGVLGWRDGSWPLWFPLLVFSPFIADATVTLVRRTVRGAKVTEPHRDHYYQHMVQMGWGHRNVALGEYAVMLVAGGTALWALHQRGSTPWITMAVWAVVYGIAMLLLGSRWKVYQQRNQSGQG